MGSAAKVDEITSDHLAVEWQDSTIFLLFHDPRGGLARREQIDRVFSLEVAGTRLEWLDPERRGLVRRRFVGPGMTTEEVTLSWGPPPRTESPDESADLIWLYSGEGNWYHRVIFQGGVVTFVTTFEAESPLIPDTYPGRTPAKRRPYQPW